MKKKLIYLSIASLFSVFFTSCSEKNEVQSKINEQNIIANLEKYSEDFLQITNKIDDEFAKTDKKNRDSNFRKALSNSKSENDVKNALRNAGFKNSDNIINLLKERLALEGEFRIQNPDFYLLDVSKRIDLLNTQYDLVLNNYISKQTSSIGTQSHTCGSKYKTDISRCNRDYAKCSIVAVITAAEGLVPGLIVGAFCAWDLSDCRSDAAEDYSDCAN